MAGGCVGIVRFIIADSASSSSSIPVSDRLLSCLTLLPVVVFSSASLLLDFFPCLMLIYDFLILLKSSRKERQGKRAAHDSGA